MSQGPPAISELWEMFGHIAKVMSNPIYCVVDGVDESNDFDCDVAKRIFNLLNMCTNVKFVLIGRPHAIQALNHLTETNIHKIEIVSAILNRDLEAFPRTRYRNPIYFSFPRYMRAFLQQSRNVRMVCFFGYD